MSPLPVSSVTFFIDHSLGGKLIAQRLLALGAQVEILADHFPVDTPDVEWLKAVGDKGWIVLTKDKRIRRDSVERAALKSAGVRAFFLTQQALTGEEMADIFAGALQGMVNRGYSQPAPFIYTLSRGGEFSLVNENASRGRRAKGGKR